MGKNARKPEGGYFFICPVYSVVYKTVWSVICFGVGMNKAEIELAMLRSGTSATEADTSLTVAQQTHRPTFTAGLYSSQVVVLAVAAAAAKKEHLGLPSYSYGTSLAICDHTVLPATRHK